METIAVKGNAEMPSNVLNDVAVVGKTLYQDFWKNGYFYNWDMSETVNGICKVNAHSYKPETDSLSDPISGLYFYAPEEVMNEFINANPHYDESGFISMLGKEYL